MTDFRAHPSEEPSFHRGRGSTGRLKIEKGPLGLYQLCVAAQPSHIFSSTAAKRFCDATSRTSEISLRPVWLISDPCLRVRALPAGRREIFMDDWR